MNIKWVGCHKNNYQKGRNGVKISKIVCHWIVGTLASADATFQDPNRIASSTYGIGDNQIHQYVREEDTPYTNSNIVSNRESITIEHQGGPNIQISESTYQTSAMLIADIAKRYNISLNRSNVLMHREIKGASTQCPGTLDVDRLVRMANDIINPPSNPTMPQDPTAQPMITVYKDIHKAMTGKDMPDDTLAFRVQQGWNTIQVIEDYLKNDGDAKSYWKVGSTIADYSALELLGEAIKKLKP